ncbi:hypothetical protein A3752_19740 [Oleiphilus sp. HI0081]|jgi:uncharacterized protein YjeT (DUF2065 family)|uniref:DUF4345 domain-containing protein n=1 Tax=unclassified Oleiphilus TaxID=2631174 RepID=UPI0007C385A8|nr:MULTISPECIES: DUF4345 domain-containing protein [unclassified Oleiphilus]KZY75282.1 hypothetical protein A3741_12440 [Oleiphilus sp. HI0069]KZY76297.1 hypothetical protein A3740_13180 [Oleiphilus sp. HI0068]KZY86169.1 hypothetical protein A3743_17455 [Oleiphilus sp. HI0072]KZZ29136.1 hypothetical protein A3752_19740 [Oleiphilus sp. HI0081]KZY35349.1 hypothetical protein A3729_17525 [Oleiphilus sp. HI0043]
MESTLKYILYALALVVAITGLNVLFGGASAIPGSTGGAEATVDNELRFFSVFWLAYGAFCFWVAQNIQAQYKFIPSIALVFFIGGLGRLISILSVGPPASVLIPAMILEFVIPIAIYGIYWKKYIKNITKQSCGTP